MLRLDMDVSQYQLRLLLKNTDNAFKLLKEQPNSDDCALNYEQAKYALDSYVTEMRLSLEKKPRVR
jgi:hypothetical protein